MGEKDFKIKRKSEIESVSYLVGKYFTGEITLKFLKIQINAIEEPIECSTTTG